jgi:hypothetical protein
MSSMSGMADADPTGGLWSWSVAGRPSAETIRAALAGALDQPVAGLDRPAPGAVLCDVWLVEGDFPTLIECFGAPADATEVTVAAAVAVRLGAGLLLPDETLNPTRYVLAEPDGTERAVHVDEIETDDGTERRHLRPCTGSDPACAAAPERDAA